MNKLVSIILPVYNADKYIKECISSLLNQTYSNFEIIIINDGSTDNSDVEILKFDDERIRYFPRDNHGLSKTLNFAIAKCNGEYIARMDADDVAFCDRLEEQVKVLSQDTVGLVCSNVEYMDEYSSTLGYSLSYTNSWLFKRLMRKGNMVFHPTVMFKKSLYSRTKGYDERINAYFEDYLLWLQMIKKSDVFVIRKPLLRYRLLPNSLSRYKPEKILEVENKVSFHGGYYPDLYTDFETALKSEKVSYTSKSKPRNIYPYSFLTVAKNIIGVINAIK
ncbi:glycosyltransferase family 2 protein [Vibrio toranzoniae]|uniref:glycosyltransferase family 2 protein n=1 Tax=Vibrio toranzoniae TaxID=1194427 RepID=UPI00137890A7|nr:glycosyltransferase [Vibrio toranzoniae]NAZ91640.1 glycosyltransferase [Vibrio toranzoniae]